MFFDFSPRQSWQEKIFDRVFKDRKICEERLLPFGFVREKHGFSFRAKLLDGMYHINFEIREDGDIHTEISGEDEKENEKLRLASKPPRSFMGRQLRKEYEEELWHVAECCFEPDVFKNELTLRLIAYIQSTYGDELEYLWRKFPKNAIVRSRNKGKWYAIFLVIPRLKLEGNSTKEIEVLNLRSNPDEMENIVDNTSRFPGYHMNKKNWISLCLDGSISFEELTMRIETSYKLIPK